MKTVAQFRKVRYRGTQKLDWDFVITATAYDLVRMRSLGGCCFLKDENAFKSASNGEENARNKFEKEQRAPNPKLPTF